MGNTINKEQAMKLIEQVCAQFQGNLQAHQNIQTALNVVKAALEPKTGEQKQELKDSK